MVAKKAPSSKREDTQLPALSTEEMWVRIPPGSPFDQIRIPAGSHQIESYTTEMTGNVMIGKKMRSPGLEPGNLRQSLVSFSWYEN